MFFYIHSLALLLAVCFAGPALATDQVIQTFQDEQNMISILNDFPQLRHDVVNDALFGFTLDTIVVESVTETMSFGPNQAAGYVDGYELRYSCEIKLKATSNDASFGADRPAIRYTFNSNAEWGDIGYQSGSCDKFLDDYKIDTNLLVRTSKIQGLGFIETTEPIKVTQDGTLISE